MNSFIPYQQLFEIDEILVVIIRNLMDDKKSINQLLLTAKWLSKRLHPTTVWTSQGILFYRYNEDTITSKMLWHLLRERRFELDLSHFQNIAQERENTDALKYLIHLARSHAEARLMVTKGLLEVPLRKMIGWHDKPKHQELTCILLGKLIRAVKNDTQIRVPYIPVPVFVEIIKRNKDQLDQSLGLAACKALRESLLSETGIDDNICHQLNLLGPLITKLMTYNCPRRIHARADQSARVLANTCQRLIEQKIKINSKRCSVELSNLAAESEEYREVIATDEKFQKLLALRSDTTKITLEVLCVFKSLADPNNAFMNEPLKQLWHDHFDELLDFCEKRVEASFPLKIPDIYHISIVPTLEFIGMLLDIIDELPNKEIVRQKFLRSSLLQRLRTLDIPDYNNLLNSIKEHWSLTSNSDMEQ